MQKVSLNNGVEMPVLGFGVFQIRRREAQNAIEVLGKVLANRRAEQAQQR